MTTIPTKTPDLVYTPRDPKERLDELKKLYTEAVRIVHRERAIREKVFGKRPELAAKVGEMDRLQEILTHLKDELKLAISIESACRLDEYIAALPTADQEHMQAHLLDIPTRNPYP